MSNTTRIHTLDVLFLFFWPKPKCKKDSEEEEAIEMNRRMTLVASDVTFPSDSVSNEQLPSAAEVLIDTPKGIPTKSHVWRFGFVNRTIYFSLS